MSRMAVQIGPFAGLDEPVRVSTFGTEPSPQSTVNDSVRPAGVPRKSVSVPRMMKSWYGPEEAGVGSAVTRINEGVLIASGPGSTSTWIGVDSVEEWPNWSVSVAL